MFVWIFSLTACGAVENNTTETEPVVEKIIEETEHAADETLENNDSIEISEDEDELRLAQSEIYHENDAEEVIEEQDPTKEYLPGFSSEMDYKTRHTGSASLITEKTVIVSIFVDEEEDVWTADEKEYVFGICDKAYSYISDTIKSEYKKNVELVYDWHDDPELTINTRVFETIPAYVTAEEERHIDELELDWVSQTKYKELMEKYDTTSIAFLYFIPHEGCSYSSMHFIDDKDYIWNEGCLLYLQDMYSPTYEYETPTVYAHELLHLFGAEDYYSSAEVFTKETYNQLKKECATDLMLSTFDTIDGVYTTYPDSVPRDITHVTAYMLGIYDESAIEYIPELEKKEPGCFAGSVFDRDF